MYIKFEGVIKDKSKIISSFEEQLASKSVCASRRGILKDRLHERGEALSSCLNNDNVGQIVQQVEGCSKVWFSHLQRIHQKEFYTYESKG